MESKKSVSPILIVVLTIIGTCLVGLCIFLGIKYFKGEEKNVSYVGAYEAISISDNETITHRLILRSDKSFVYNLNASIVTNPLVGTYEIDGNKLTLIGTVNYGSDACFYTSSKTINATIKDDNTISIVDSLGTLDYKRNSSFVESETSKKRYVISPVDGELPITGGDAWLNCDNKTNQVIDFPQKSDDTAVIGKLTDFLTESTLKTNFKNLEFTKNGNKIVFNCENYSDSMCLNIKVNIGDFSFSTEEYDKTYGLFEYYGHYKIFKVNNYYIVYTDFGSGLDINKITIYDKANKVYTNNLVKSFYNEDNNTNSLVNTVPSIVNNILYFIQQNESYDTNKVQFKSIDLSKGKIEEKLIKEFTGYISGEK